ncbi:hypothetical protein A2943_01235 [Candidatus Adlerbacteria bacterium RIFCSPLOWO2_01_FULL_51_16]|uniref:Uncharacterized protein n=1 Tax=Candidatus Adlerbacteria bacterium RIFCSPLOWO2_01_FULL_51_16 TaxID=1797243 RepID=A0A1F4XFI1_9BACT|nr:MAG: hypothetical protein A2943_01235 [Candidatus Adlerbacteria bacterium RIFCSPLOWO2_01_FULL_51_16]
MESETQKQIEERLGELPEDVRLAILSADFEKKVQTVGAKYNLHIDQLEVLGDETMLIMLGFADPSTFAANIEKQVRVSTDQAHKIGAEITEQIFLPIRESMKKFMEGRAKEAPIVSAPPPPSTPTPKPVPPPSAPPKPTPPPAPAGQSPLGGAKPAVAPTAPIAPMPPIMQQAQIMLSEKTVSKLPEKLQTGKTAPQPPAASSGQTKPPPYKADPYREPPE